MNTVELLPPVTVVRRTSLPVGTGRDKDADREANKGQAL